MSAGDSLEAWRKSVGKLSRRDSTISTMTTYLEGQIAKHQLNLEMMIENEHRQGHAADYDYTDSIEDELAELHGWMGKLTALKSLGSLGLVDTSSVEVLNG